MPVHFITIQIDHPLCQNSVFENDDNSNRQLPGIWEIQSHSKDAYQLPGMALLVPSYSNQSINQSV